MMNLNYMKTLFTLSFLVAAAAFLGPWIVFHDFGRLDSATRISVFLVKPWLVPLAVARFRFRKKGLWLLSGLPFALCWPFVFLAIGFACGQDVRICP
jgi:hypothetical protein